METTDIQVLNTELVRDAQYESQIDIAKRYPRDLRRILDNSIVIATMDKETAEICNFNLPRSGKNISGASVHLARIIVQQYGNIRVESRVVGHDGKQVHAEAICFDLETNVAVKSTTSKSILYTNGGRYKEDMIITTGKAAAAIAYRNAVFSVVPKSIVDKVYKAAMDFITGDLSDEAKLIKRRKGAIDKFKEEFGVEEKELLTAMGLNTINQIKQAEIVTLIGMFNSLKDGETTVDEMFSRKKEKAPKTAIPAKEYKKLIDDLWNYKISLKSAEQIAAKYETTEKQLAEIKEAGTITDERLVELTDAIIAGNITLKELEFIITEQEKQTIIDAIADQTE